MARTSAQARRHLDARLGRLRPLVDEPRPHRGWIRAIRDALGMSTTELAARMRVGQSTVVDIEDSETHATIKLDTLKRAADALECELVYALIPRSTLEEAVRTQARRKAAQHLKGVAHHMRLEDQAVDDDDGAAQLDDLSSRLVDRRGLWSELPAP
jgi:predicted DNA-binding mobile mystery protein A